MSRQLVQLFYFDLLEKGIYPARRGQMTLSLPMGESDFDEVASAVGDFVNDRRELIEAAAAINS